MVSKKSIAAVLLLGIALTAILATAGCVNTGNAEAADAIYLGNVITMDDANPTAEAVAVKTALFCSSALQRMPKTTSVKTPK